MSCASCKKLTAEVIKRSDDMEKIRKLAQRIAEMDGKTQIILEFEGKLSISCEECWMNGGRIGRPIEFFII